MNETLLAKLILLQMRQNQYLTQALEAQMDTSWSDRFSRVSSNLDSARNLLDQAEKLVAESTPPAVS